MRESMPMCRLSVKENADFNAAHSLILRLGREESGTSVTQEDRGGELLQITHKGSKTFFFYYKNLKITLSVIVFYSLPCPNWVLWSPLSWSLQDQTLSSWVSQYETCAHYSLLYISWHRLPESYPFTPPEFFTKGSSGSPGITSSTSPRPTMWIPL